MLLFSRRFSFISSTTGLDGQRPSCKHPWLLTGTWCGGLTAPVHCFSGTWVV